jgi:hypothetical protein
MEVHRTRHIGSHSSRDKLKITRQIFTQIFTYHQVLPAYLDFYFEFGVRIDAYDLRFCNFRKQIHLKLQPADLVIPALGRSGRHYQPC